LMAFDEEYEEKLIWESFRADLCPNLVGKPKLFLIQSCRDYQIDTSSIDTNIDSTRGHRVVDTDAKGYLRIPSLNRPPSLTDTVIMHSTLEGYSSNRDPEHGTWFIQAFCLELEHLEDKKKKFDFVHMLQRVIGRVRGRKNSEGESFHEEQTPLIRHSTLTKPFYIVPKNKKFVAKNNFCSFLTTGVRLVAAVRLSTLKTCFPYSQKSDKNASSDLSV
jgi:Caspase domain